MKVLKSHTTHQFESNFIHLPKVIISKAERKIKIFENNYFHPGLDTHKLKGILKSFWSFSIDNDYRVIFRFLPHQEVIYYRIGPHKIYKELEKIIGA
ncbi:MAG TPA: type II toxin-antitoxin system mRNA interferase toxin, RelE/StbE family [Candidatus Paceibacterota bacterium]|nr:type II toxin-antitoxin system mRNA interferase toxin, RelE/StbE family [Candidatus Paceibacterota bacterium]